MNIRLREAVEELERRLQTNYERSGAREDVADDTFYPKARVSTC